MGHKYKTITRDHVVATRLNDEQKDWVDSVVKKDKNSGERSTSSIVVSKCVEIVMGMERDERATD